MVDLVKENFIKRLLLILLPLLLIIGCSEHQKEYDYNNLLFNKVNNTFSTKFTDLPVSGNIFKIFKDKKTSLGFLQNGKKEGLWTDWYKNGQKRYEGNYKGGKLIDLIEWYKNGQKKVEGTWKDGRREGVYTTYYKNRQKSSDETFKDGKEIYSKRWNENGSLKG